MKQTEQYGLNQWELSDPIRMQDFNADNARLEEILGGKAGRSQIIKEYAVPQGYKIIALDFGVSDWSEWECVVATLDLQETSFQADDIFILQIIDTSYNLDKTGVFQGLRGASLCVMLFPRHNKASTLQGFAAGSGGAPLFLRRPFEEVRGLSVLVKKEIPGSSPTQSDTTFNNGIWTVYGIK